MYLLLVVIIEYVSICDMLTYCAYISFFFFSYFLSFPIFFSFFCWSCSDPLTRISQIHARYWSVEVDLRLYVSLVDAVPKCAPTVLERLCAGKPLTRLAAAKAAIDALCPPKGMDNYQSWVSSFLKARDQIKGVLEAGTDGTTADGEGDNDNDDKSIVAFFKYIQKGKMYSSTITHNSFYNPLWYTHMHTYTYKHTYI